MTESLSHKELKNKAIQKLKEMGFSDEQIGLEKWVYFKWESKDRRYRVDVLGDNGDKKIIFQVGNHGKIEIDLLKKFFETHYIAYPKFNPFPEKLGKSEETLRERKAILIKTYNELAKHFINDEVYDLVEYGTKTDDVFKLGKDGSWMLLPCSSTANKDELMNNINILLNYESNDYYTIAINSETNAAIKLFLDIMPRDKEKYIKEINKLPPGYFVQDGFKYRVKGKNPLMRMPRDWDDVLPYEARLFSMDDLIDVEDRLNYWLDSKEEKYPILRIISIVVKKNELLRVFQQLRPVYKILRTMETFEKNNLEKIKNLPKWCWYIEEKEFADLYELYSEKYPDENIKFSDFKKLINILKKDKEYLKYKNG